MKMSRKKEKVWFEALKLTENIHRHNGIEELERVVRDMESDIDLSSEEELVLLTETQQEARSAIYEYLTHLKHLEDIEASKMVFNTDVKPL